MLLTLAIPTYNRAENLRGTLQSFLTQIEQHGLSEVEVVVSDNCSTDNTAEVCADVAVEYPGVSIRYFRNDSNLGFDGNVTTLFRHASGKYIWTFSDDDIPAPNALSHVTHQLRQREARFAFVNYQVNVDGQLLPSRFGTGADRWVEARDVLKIIRFSNSLISSCIFLRDAWLGAASERFVGTLWIHFFVAREVLQTGKGLIIGRPMFTMMQSGLEKSRAEKRREGDKGIDYYMMAHLKFAEFAHELHCYSYDQETIELACSLSRQEDLLQVVNFKLTAPRYSISQLAETWRQMARFGKSDFLFWLAITPLLAMPSWTVKLARVGYRTLKSWQH